MKPNKVETFSRYQEIVKQYGGKECMSNDYIQWEVEDLVVHNALYECCGEKNAFILVKKDEFWRLYYYLNDPSEILYLDEEMVTEILFRGSKGEPSNIVDYLEQCGFVRNIVRDQYFAKYVSLSQSSIIPGLRIDEVSTLEDAEWAINLFNKSFDKWSGDYIPISQAFFLLQDKAILIAKDMNDEKLGALHLEKKLGVTYLNHVVVLENIRGRGVGLGLVDAFIEKGHTDESSRYMLWVQRQNAQAVNLYKKKGFVYMNKSTLSMIKHKIEE